MLRVGVFIDLRWRPEAGGHVKSWERFAEAACTHPKVQAGELDLTLHFLGEREDSITLDKHVRYRLHPALFSTQRIPFLDKVADHTDLAPYNKKLDPYLAHYDVLHSTHALFTFGATALRYAKRHGTPLINSIHTDVPKYTTIFTADVVRRLFGAGRMSRLLLERWGVHRRRGAAMARKLERYWRFCEHVIVSQEDDYRHVAKVLPESRISYLRRGIDLARFAPAKERGRALRERHGIGEDRSVLLFVGRLDPAKNVMTVAQAVQGLLEQALPVHALFVGAGACEADIRALLGEHATLCGVLPQTELAEAYAAADLLVFPSQTETYGNVVVEAKAAGTAVAVSAQGGTGQLVKEQGADGITVDGVDPEVWARALGDLIATPGRLTDMGAAARRHIETDWPSWQTVLDEDLIPVWEAAANRNKEARKTD